MFVLVRDSSSENFVKAGISSTEKYDSKENQQNIEIYTVSGCVAQKNWFKYVIVPLGAPRILCFNES